MVNKANKKDFSHRLDKLSMLKASATIYPESPELAKLEIFDNIYSDRDFVITFDCQEFTSLCPVTGQPDFGVINIRYIPNKSCVESKSLKLYLYSYRNYNTFHEEAVNMILDKLISECKPRKAEVTGIFRPRGGIAIHVTATFGGKI